MVALYRNHRYTHFLSRAKINQNHLGIATSINPGMG